MGNMDYGIQLDPEGQKGPGKIRLMQNVAHGLVVADWIGRMLELGFDRLALHDLTGHPCFQHVDVGKWTRPDKPQYTVVGLAITAFTQQFGQEMLKVSWTNNPARLDALLGSPKYHEQPHQTHRYPSLSRVCGPAGRRQHASHRADQS